MSSNMITVREVAERAGVHIESVRRWIRQGQLPASLSARKKGYMVREEDLENFLNQKNKIRQKGQVEAEQVLKSLAKAWDETGHRRYITIAYEVAQLSGVLEDFRKEWDSWDGDLADPDVDGRLLDSRRRQKQNWQEDKEGLKRIEGQLILQSYLNISQH